MKQTVNTFTFEHCRQYIYTLMYIDETRPQTNNNLNCGVRGCRRLITIKQILQNDGKFGFPEGVTIKLSRI